MLDIVQIHMYTGEKKKHRKEMIAVKRRERMRRLGVDLEQISLVRNFFFFLIFIMKPSNDQ